MCVCVCVCVCWENSIVTLWYYCDVYRDYRWLTLQCWHCCLRLTRVALFSNVTASFLINSIEQVLHNDFDAYILHWGMLCSTTHTTASSWGYNLTCFLINLNPRIYLLKGIVSSYNCRLSANWSRMRPRCNEYWAWRMADKFACTFKSAHRDSLCRAFDFL